MTDIIPVIPTFDVSILAGRIAPSSMKMYARDFKAYLDYAQTPELAMQSSTLARWITHLSLNTTYSPNTINRMVAAVKRLIKEAQIQGYVPPSTWDAFRMIDGVTDVALKERLKENSRVRIEPEDMRRIADTPDISTPMGLRDRAILHTMASSGLRVHELVKLKVSDIVITKKGCQVMVLGKNDVKPRVAPLSDEAQMYIEEWTKTRAVPSQFIFTQFAGRGNRLTSRPITTMSLWRFVKHYAQLYGMGTVAPHDFRRFVGTQLASTNPRTAQKALGHKKIATTMDNYVLDELEVGVTNNLY